MCKYHIDQTRDHAPNESSILSQKQSHILYTAFKHLWHSRTLKQVLLLTMDGCP